MFHYHSVFERLIRTYLYILTNIKRRGKTLPCVYISDDGPAGLYFFRSIYSLLSIYIVSEDIS